MTEILRVMLCSRKEIARIVQMLSKNRTCERFCSVEQASWSIAVLAVVKEPCWGSLRQLWRKDGLSNLCARVPSTRLKCWSRPVKDLPETSTGKLRFAMQWPLHREDSCRACRLSSASDRQCKRPSPSGLHPREPIQVEGGDYCLRRLGCLC